MQSVISHEPLWLSHIDLETIFNFDLTNPNHGLLSNSLSSSAAASELSMTQTLKYWNGMRIWYAIE
jgi:hypothetical protein